MLTKHPILLISTTLSILICITYWIYSPGLHSSPYLDDFPNLESLQNNNDIVTITLSRPTGGIGRPLAHFSFALQKDDYPGHPHKLKQVNLVIHIVNGILVFFIALLLSRHVKISPKDQLIFSTIATAFWLVTPAHSTTVLYIVQRMAILSTTFMLAGILAYLIVLNKTKLSSAKSQMIAVALVYAGTILGVLSKENAILLPLIILVFHILLSTKEEHKNHKAFIYALLFPLLLFAIYLLYSLETHINGYSGRDFSLSERLITQLPALADYIKLALIPLPDSYSLFHDDYMAYGELLHAKVLISLFLLASLIVLAIHFRKKSPMLTVGISLFFIGHFLESSHIPLELFFEHRNYFPSIGIFILLSFILTQLIHLNKKAGLLVTAIYLILTIWVTRNETDDWHYPNLMAYKWYNSHPNSVRAIDHYADFLVHEKKYEDALSLINRLGNLKPDDYYPNLAFMRIKACEQKEIISAQEWKFLHAKLSQRKFRVAAKTELTQLTSRITSSQCPQLEGSNFIKLIKTAAINNHYDQRILGNLADLYIYHQDLSSALQVTYKRYKKTSNPYHLFYAVSILYTQGKLNDAAKVLGRIKKESQRNILIKTSVDKKLKYWQQKLDSSTQRTH